MHVFDKLDSDYLIHKGVVGPSLIRTRFESKPSSDLGPRLVDDWSFSTDVRNPDNQGQGQYFFPISPTYTDFTTNFAPVVVNNYSKDACGGPVQNFSKVLVEEYDGYTWRRIAGLGPLPGRETYNVTVTDSIPKELQWSKFTDNTAVGVTATYTPLSGHPKFSGYVKWTIPVMMVGEKGDLSFETIAKNPCTEKNFENTGWIWSDVDSPISSTVALQLTCNPVPPPEPKETSLNKTADKTNTKTGETVKYTLTFKNTDGSAVTWDGASVTASDWQTLGANTTLPQLNESTISLDQNSNNAIGSSGYSFGHKKSHGKNGWTETTINKTNASTLSLIYRYQSGTPGAANFSGVRLEITPGTQNVINFTLYNNNTALPAVTNVAYPGTDKPFIIRTELIDDKLYIWINDFTGAPLKVISGITQLTAGYAGVWANSSQQALSTYKTHWDSSFDLVITDPVPSSLDVITTSISDAGTLAVPSNTITWPTIPGPILAGQVITRTFEATVNTCNNFITNIGKASVYGIANIQSQYVVSCATTSPLFFTNIGIKNNELNWSVAHAEKGKFIVMASENNQNFVQIGSFSTDGSTTNHHFNVNSDQFTYYKVIFVSDKNNGSVSSKTVHSALDHAGVALYPNPFTSELFIDIKDEIDYNVHIYTVTGASIQHITHLSKGVHKLPSNLAPGVYVVQVSSEEETTYFKVVKE